jgi:Amt family ammonium transporter
MKNISDMAVTCVGFFLTGWALAFGVNADGGANPLTGEGEFLLIGSTRLDLFVFQYAFAATAVTIVSGAVVG